jgi:heme a synthase
MINSSNYINGSKLFRRLALLTVLSIYLLILAGGVVRSTGSGMGCPDWPKCFGQWIPPTQVSQLPADYQQMYAHRGYSDTTFNPVKTWIEYLNRLLGALTGIFVLATFATSLTYIKKRPSLTYVSLSALVLVGIQGWLGAKVVSHLLAPWIVTLHMLLALLIVSLLLFVAVQSNTQATEGSKGSSYKKRVYVWLIISSILLTIQILFGTQVREGIDMLSAQLDGKFRDQWIGRLGATFITHRTMSWFVLISVGIWVRLAFRVGEMPIMRSIALLTILLTGVEIGVGAVMAYMAIPPLAQTIHLFIAVVLLGIQFTGLLLIRRQRDNVHYKVVDVAPYGRL